MIRALWRRPWLWLRVWRTMREIARDQAHAEHLGRAAFYGCGYSRCDRVVKGSEGARLYRAWTICPKRGCTSKVAKYARRD